jgi:hypothetical protein
VIFAVAPPFHTPGGHLTPEGMIPEELHSTQVDIAAEMALARSTRASGADDNKMRQLGASRARELGFLDVYTLTKAMGEMLVSQVACEVSLLVLVCVLASSRQS